MSPRPLLLLSIALGALVSGLGPSAAPARAGHSTSALLPDLAMLPPSDFKIEQSGRRVRLLRFSTIIVNLGPGPFQVYGWDPAGISTTRDAAVVQQIQEPGGGFVDHATDAKIFWSGDGHNHFHVRDLQDMTLQNLTAEVLATGAKRGFCFWDNYRYGSDLPVYYHPSTTDACELAPDGTVPMGLSVGWGDRYPYNIAYQYIDITGMPNGTYIVHVSADPPLASGGLFLEADESNNTAWAEIRIQRKSVTVLSTSPLP